MHRHVVVTGGAGFIGSHLTERLLADGHDVLVVDNLATGRVENLTALGHEPRLDFAKLDVTDAEAVRKALGGRDWVFHLAALADIVPSMERPLDYTNANVTGTFAVLEGARHGGAKRFLYTASSSCYGIPDVYPTPETAPARPQYPYALSKYLGEQAAMHWAQAYRLPVVSLRLFNVYGPRARTGGTYGAVFGVFLAQKLAQKPFTIVGDGTQTRDFTFVTDIAEAFVRAAEGDVAGAAMNVGSRRPTSVNRIAELLGGERVYVPKRPGEPDSTHADTAAIERALGWHAQVSIEEGVRVMLSQIDYWRNAPVWTPERIEEATRSWFRYLGEQR